MQVLARRHQQRDMHRHVFQSTSTATSTPVQQFKVRKCIILWYVCIAMDGRGASNGACSGRYFNQYRHLPSAPAEHVWGIYIYNVNMYRDGGTSGKRRRAGAGNGTCTGTYSNPYRPVTSAPA